MPSKAATVHRLERELKTIKEAFEDYISSSKQLEDGLDKELTDMQARLARSTKMNESLSSQLECMDPLLQNLENALQATKAKLNQEQYLRQQADAARMEMERRYQSDASNWSILSEENKVLSETCNTLNTSCEALKSKSFTLNAELEKKSRELDEARSEEKKYKERWREIVSIKLGNIHGDEEGATHCSSSKDDASSTNKTARNSIVEASNSGLMDELEKVTEQFLVTQKRLWESEDKLGEALAKVHVLEESAEAANVEALRNDNRNLVREKQLLEEKIQAVGKDLDAANEELDMKDEELQATKEDLKITRQKVKSLVMVASIETQDDSQNYINELTALQDELAMTREELRTSEEEVDQLQAQLQTIENSNMKLRKELVAQRKEIEQQKQLQPTPGQLEEREEQVNKLQNELGVMETKAKTTEAKVTQYDKKLEKAKEENVMLNEEISCLRTALQNQKALTERANQKMSSVESKAIEQRIEKEVRETITKEVEDRVSTEAKIEREREINVLREQFKKIFKDNAILREKIDDASTSVSEMHEIKERVPKLKEEIARLNLLLESVKEDHKSALAEKDVSLHKRLHEVKAESRKEMESKIAQIKQTIIEESELEAEKLREEMQALAHEKDQLQFKLEEIEDDLRRALKEKAKINELWQQAEANFEATRSEVDTLHQKIRNLSISLEDADAASERFKEEKEDMAMELELAEQLLKDERIEMEKSLSENKDEINSLKRKMYSLNISLEESKQESAATTEELEACKKLFADEQEREKKLLEAAESQVYELKQEVEQLKTKLEFDTPMQAVESANGFEIETAHLVERIDELSSELDDMRNLHAEVCRELDRTKEELVHATKQGTLAFGDSTLKTAPNMDTSVTTGIDDVDHSELDSLNVRKEVDRAKEELVRPSEQGTVALRDSTLESNHDIDTSDTKDEPVHPSEKPTVALRDSTLESNHDMDMSDTSGIDDIDQLGFDSRTVPENNENDSDKFYNQVKELTIELDEAREDQAQIRDELRRTKQQLVKAREEAADSSKDLIFAMAKKIDELTASKNHSVGEEPLDTQPLTNLWKNSDNQEVAVAVGLVEKIEELSFELDQARVRHTEVCEELDRTKLELDNAREEAEEASKDLIFGMAKQIDDLNAYKEEMESRNAEAKDAQAADETEKMDAENQIAELAEKVRELTSELDKAREHHLEVCEELDSTKLQLIKARKEAAEASNDLVFEMAKKIEELSGSQRRTQSQRKSAESDGDINPDDEILNLIEKLEELSEELDEERAQNALVLSELEKTKQDLEKARHDNSKISHDLLLQISNVDSNIHPLEDSNSKEINRDVAMFDHLSAALESSQKQNMALRKDLEAARKDLEAARKEQKARAANELLGGTAVVGIDDKGGNWEDDLEKDAFARIENNEESLFGDRSWVHEHDASHSLLLKARREADDLHVNIMKLSDENAMLRRTIESQSENDEIAAKEISELKLSIAMSGEETNRLKKKVVSLNTVLKQAIADHAIELKYLKESLDTTCQDTATNVRECADVEARADIDEARRQERELMGVQLRALLDENGALQTKLEATERALEIANEVQESKQDLIDMFEDRINAYDARLKAATDEKAELKEELLRLQTPGEEDVTGSSAIDNSQPEVYDLTADSSDSHDRDLVALKVEVATLNEAVSEAKRSCADLMEELRTVKLENEDLHRALTHEQQILTDEGVHTSPKDQGDEKEDLVAQLEGLREEKAALQHRLDDSKIALSVSQYAQERQKEELRVAESKFESAHEEAEALKSEILNLKGALSAAKQDHETAVNELRVLDSRIGQESTCNENTISTGSTSSKADIQETTGNRPELEQKLADLEKQLAESQQELEGKRDELATMESRLISSREETRMLTDEISHLSAAFENSKSEYDAVVDELEAVNELFAEARQESERSGREAAARELQNELKAAREKEQTLMKEQLNKILEENSVLRKNLEEAERLLNVGRVANVTNAEDSPNGEESTDSVSEKSSPRLDEEMTHVQNEEAADIADVTEETFDLVALEGDRGSQSTFSLMKAKCDTTQMEMKLEDELLEIKVSLEKLVDDKKIVKQIFERVKKSVGQVCAEAGKLGRTEVAEEIRAAVATERDREIQKFKDQFNKLVEANSTLQQKLKDAEIGIALAKESQERTKDELKRLESAFRASKAESQKFQHEVSQLNHELKSTHENHERVLEEIRATMTVERDEMVRSLTQRLDVISVENTTLQGKLQESEGKSDDATCDSSLKKSGDLAMNAPAQEAVDTNFRESSSLIETKALELQISYLRDSLREAVGELDLMTQRFFEACNEAEKAGAVEAASKLRETVSSADTKALELEHSQASLQSSLEEAETLKINLATLNESLRDSQHEWLKTLQHVQKLDRLLEEVEEQGAPVDSQAPTADSEPPSTEAESVKVIQGVELVSTESVSPGKFGEDIRSRISKIYSMVQQAKKSHSVAKEEIQKMTHKLAEMESSRENRESFQDEKEMMVFSEQAKAVADENAALQEISEQADDKASPVEEKDERHALEVQEWQQEKDERQGLEVQDWQQAPSGFENELKSEATEYEPRAYEWTSSPRKALVQKSREFEEAENGFTEASTRIDITSQPGGSETLAETSTAHQKVERMENAAPKVFTEDEQHQDEPRMKLSMSERLQARLDRIAEARTKRIQEMDKFAEIMETKGSRVGESFDVLESDGLEFTPHVQQHWSQPSASDSPTGRFSTPETRTDAEAIVEFEENTDLFESESRDDDTPVNKFRSIESQVPLASLQTRSSQSQSDLIDPLALVPTGSDGQKRTKNEAQAKSELQVLDQLESDEFQK